jgi:hypothetical protein
MRTEIKRDTKGNPFKTPPKQGDEVVRVQVTHSVPIPKGFEDLIFKTAVAGKDALHKSTKVRGQGNLNPMGYIHGPKNTCLLVTRMGQDRAKKIYTIQIDKLGDVNNGWHVFG